MWQFFKEEKVQSTTRQGENGYLFYSGDKSAPDERPDRKDPMGIPRGRVVDKRCERSIRMIDYNVEFGHDNFID